MLGVAVMPRRARETRTLQAQMYPERDRRMESNPAPLATATWI